MAKQIIISKDSDQTVHIEADHTDLLVEKGVNVAVADGFGIHNAKYDHTHMTIDGHVNVVSDLNYAGISTYGTGDFIEIGADGSVKGPSAVQLHGKDESVVNRGTVNGSDYGVRGDDGGYYVANLGKITSIQGYAVALGGGDDTVVNRGVINGTLETGDGADHIDLRHGTVNGGVMGDDGDDVYVIGKGSFASLYDSDGHDTIMTSLSYTAQPSEGIEDFIATGHRNINLKGDTGNNALAGNDGDNRLSGGAGEDSIGGDKGRDVLTGGADADTFYFYKGDGGDRITDFDSTGIDHDVIDFAKFGHLSFDDLMSMADSHNGNMVFHFGNGDRLVIEGVTPAEIAKEDVQVNGVGFL
jgi:Ca2+-binding RTX toxin-like protein